LLTLPVRYALTLFVTIVCYSSLWSQDNIIDSIIAVNPNAEKLQLAEVFRQSGIHKKNQGQYLEAERLYQKAQSVFIENGDSVGYAKVLNNLGYVYLKLNNKKKALNSYFNGIKLTQEIKYPLGLAKIYINLAAFFYLQNDLVEALKYYSLSADALENLDQPKLLADVQMGMGNILMNETFENRDFLKARQAYLNALTGYKKLGDKLNISRALINTGKAFEVERELDKAFDNYKESLAIKEQLDDKAGMLISFLNIGNILRQQNKFKESLEYYEKGESLAILLKDGSNHLHIITNMIDVKMALGEVDVASEIFETYRKLKDSLYNEEKSRQINELRMLYDSEKKEFDLAKEQEENRIKTIRNQWLIGLTVGLMILIVAIFILFYNRLSIVKKLRAQEHIQAIKEKEIGELNSLMLGGEMERIRIAKDLHDRIGSQLSAIKLIHGQYAKKGNDIGRNVEEMLDTAIVETREISHNLASSSLSRYGLVSALDQFLEKIKDSNQIDAEFISTNIKKRLPEELERALYYIVQEMVSNTLNHAKAKNICLQLIKNNNNVLNLIYEDDGIGFDVNKIVFGMGLKNIQARLTPFKTEVKIDSSPNLGTTFMIEVSKDFLA